MTKSSLLKTRLRLLQCYDREPTASCVSQNGSFQSPCSLWEQEYRSSTDIRQPSTVNRVLVSCSGVIENSLLLVCHTERRPQIPCSMWEQELNRYPSTLNRVQASAWIAASNRSRIVLEPDRFWTISWFNTRSLKHCVFSCDLNVLTASAVILVLIIGTLVRSCRSILSR